MNNKAVIYGDGIACYQIADILEDQIVGGDENVD